MAYFLIFFFFVYGSMHFYAFMKVKAAFSFGALVQAGILLFMAVMIAAPIVIRYAERSGHESLARISSYAGYTWLAVIFLFCSVSVFIDICRLLIYTGEALFNKDLSFLAVPIRYSFLVALLLSISASVYGYFEAANIRTERITLKSSKLPAGSGRLRVVQISDVHLGLTIGRERLEKILEKVRSADPDILVSTGDLVDGQVYRLNGLSDLLRDIRPRFGKFAVTGNHEFHAGFNQARRFTEDAGFTLLRGDKATIPGVITVAGVDDPVVMRTSTVRQIAEKDLLADIRQGEFVLLLKHRPLADKAAEGLFDLQLSGHVHKGQIFPFSIITWLYYPFPSGYFELAGGAHLYVSRGTGTWGPPIRFMSPPEVTVIDILPEPDPGKTIDGPPAI